MFTLIYKGGRGDSKMAEEEKMNGIDAGKATSIARKYLEDNYGNLGMLLFRVESVEKKWS